MSITEQIITYPHEVLIKKTVTITKKELKGELKTILTEVKKYVEENKGVAGLALPQIGLSKKAFVAKLMLDGKEKTEIFINPRIQLFPKERQTEHDNEGCLSIPGEFFKVERFLKVKIIYQDLNFKGHELILKDWNARVVQHENDHLNGILISQIGERAPSEVMH